jgi:hypothetical protein
MAEDERIEILIKAVDEASQTLKNIEKQIQTTAKNSEKANVSLGDSFKKVQGAMLNLGQVAQGIHNIFETNERATRNLENAQDRLENATLRLKQAQQDLSDVEKNHARDSLTLEKATIANTRAQEDLRFYTNRLEQGITFTGEKLKNYQDAQIRAKEAALDLADAQQLSTDKAKELKDKQDALIIATNNVDRATRGLEKAQGDAKWAMVDMGVQAISVAGNLGSLATAIGGTGGLTSMFTSLTTAVGVGGLLATGGTVAAIVGLITVLGMLTPETPSYVAAIQTRIANLEELRKKADETEKAFYDLMIQEQKLKSFQYLTGSGQYGGRVTQSGYTPKGMERAPSYIPIIPTAPKFTVINNIGTIQGISATQISRSLSNELNNKLSL